MCFDVCFGVRFEVHFEVRFEVGSTRLPLVLKLLLFSNSVRRDGRKLCLHGLVLSGLVLD